MKSLCGGDSSMQCMHGTPPHIRSSAEQVEMHASAAAELEWRLQAQHASHRTRAKNRKAAHGYQA
jgi:hypothetical protein